MTSRDGPATASAGQWADNFSPALADELRGAAGRLPAYTR